MGASVPVERRIKILAQETMLSTIVLISVLIPFFQFVRGDLPIHANTYDVAGTWVINLGKEYDAPQTCSSTTPNSNTGNLKEDVQNYSAWLERHGGKVQTIEANLSLDRAPAEKDKGIEHREKWERLTARVTKGGDEDGYWTMVYDEGFEARLGDTQLFALLKYSPVKAQSCPPVGDGDSENEQGRTACYATDPRRTQVGWFFKDGPGGRTFGCFHAARTDAQPDSAVKHAFVVVKDPQRPKNSTDDTLKAYLESLVVAHSNETSTWTAKAHPSLSTIDSHHAAKMMGHLGYQKYHVNPLFQSSGMSFLEAKSADTQGQQLYACHEKAAAIPDSLPKSFSWGDPFTVESFSENPINQGACGSCYSIAATYALQKRFEIALIKAGIKGFSEFNNQPLSPQSVVSCSFFNQGCDGGYPYLVGKWAKEDGVASENCMSYDPHAQCKLKKSFSALETSTAGTSESCSTKSRWYAKDYGYIGGAYELCGEKEMMEEIHSRGPIAVALEVPQSLFGYSSGIFDATPEAHHRYCSGKKGKLNGWEYTNHAVAVVGWGEQKQADTSEPVKYWIVRNSWGSEWGKGGYVKIRRGKNLGGIESQAVYLDPDLTRGRAAQVLSSQNLRPKKAIKRHSLFDSEKREAEVSPHGQVTPRS